MAEGRDDRGRFVKGNHVGNGGGRPDKADRDNLRAIIRANVSAEAEAAAWQRIEQRMLEGKKGWEDAFVLYLSYNYGKPSQFVDVASGGQSLQSLPPVVFTMYEEKPEE
jgi:hypothetical protein